MNTLAAGFNRSRFSRFLNSPSGRIFRIVAGAGFIAIGLIAVAAGQLIGIAALAWVVLPLSAGALDICYVSAALGGALRRKQIRSAY